MAVPSTEHTRALPTPNLTTRVGLPGPACAAKPLMTVTPEMTVKPSFSMASDVRSWDAKTRPPAGLGFHTPPAVGMPA